MLDSAYVELARRDSLWREVTASMKISGFELNVDFEVLAGRLVAGELDIGELIGIVRLRSQSMSVGLNPRLVTSG